MVDLTEYKKLILKNIDQLTKNQKKIAQFLLDKPEEIAFSSIDIVADKLKLGKATVVRFAQAIGYKGFLELKTELSNMLRSDLSLTKKFQAIINNVSLDSDFVTTLANNEINNIHTTLQSIEQASFDKAIRIFVSAENIYTMGLGISSFLSQIAAYFLNRVTKKAKAFTHGSISFQEQIVSLTKKDAILAISLPPYSIATVESAEHARENKIKVISITDQIVSPIAQHSDVVFAAKTQNVAFINTVSSIMMIIYALAAGIGLEDRESSIRALSLFEKAKSEFGFDVHTDFFK